MSSNTALGKALPSNSHVYYIDNLDDNTKESITSILETANTTRNFITNNHSTYCKISTDLQENLESNLLKSEKIAEVIEDNQVLSELSTNLNKAYRYARYAVRDQLNDNLKSLYNKADKLINSDTDSYSFLIADYTANDGLITDASQLSTNAQEPTEGSLAALIDNKTNTFFHSTWSHKSPTDDYHYLQVDLKNAYKQIALKYTKRQGAYGGDGNPQTLHVYVTNTPNDESCWIDLGRKTCTYKYDSNQTGILNINFDSKAYRHIRLVVEATLGNDRTNGNLFFYWSELHAYTRVSRNNSLSEETHAALTTAMAKAKVAIDEEWATEDTYDNLLEAYNTANNEIEMENDNQLIIDFAKSFYLTAYSDKTLIVPTGVKAAIVVANGNGIRNDYRYNSGDVIPAHTGVLLQGGKGNSFCLTTTENSEEAPEDNLLHGTLNDETTYVEGTDKYYKLAYDKATGTEIGFYWGADNGGAFVNKGGKAFLALPATMNAAQLTGFSLFNLDNEGTITGIQQTQTTPATNSFKAYDINGRCVNAQSAAELSKGIYIVNGKKVIIK